MSQQREFQMVGGNNPAQFNDTTFTKIFIGGLAWETQRDTIRRYFEQFGEILEAVVITDKTNGRSKGYGFVSSYESMPNPASIIDGKRANCNLASLGAQKTPPMISQQGARRFRPAPGPGLTAPPSYHGSSSAYIQQPTCQYSIPYSAYGTLGCFIYYVSSPSFYICLLTGTTDFHKKAFILWLNYYSLYGGQQISPYYTSGASITPGMFHNFFPLYAQNNQAHGFGVQYPQIVQYPYLPQQYSSMINLSLPSSMPMAATTTETVATAATTSTPPSTTTTPPTAIGVVGM
ncbi:hypothetical protein ERO13_A11G100700v2 [Gossypium hirsutum]|uniref:RRM domain-containing protein n=1 Tax=Gossypium barbadense TaxID=3634 RepID=A0A5J5TP82_GOSBA|nr:hypothetical protein ES319_A11G108000v1 [Gossypium barbadense]KAG4174120.1 hypothetical protein ERO13_A11G100700v2 [Gossypium hirsutum]